MTHLRMKNTPHCVFCGSDQHHTVDHQMAQKCSNCGYPKSDHRNGKYELTNDDMGCICFTPLPND